MSDLKKLEPQYLDQNRRRTADGGATSKEIHNVFMCECGELVVWHKSKKTGTSYLANCLSYNNSDALWFAANSPHFTTCGKSLRGILIKEETK